MIEIDETEFNEEEIHEELNSDLRRLFKEARQNKGNSTSRRIVEGIDKWLRTELETVIDEKEKEIPLFEYKLYSPKDWIKE